MSETNKTFPSEVAKAGLPHHNISNQLKGSKPSLKVDNPFAAFRKQYLDYENARVGRLVKQTALNTRRWNTQSTKQGIVNIPAGSFNRGANLSSGNNVYGFSGGAYGGSHCGCGSYSGGVRTAEGSAYYRDLLQKRAAQFDAIRALKEGAPAVVEDTQPLPLDKDEANLVAIELLIQTIQDSFVEAHYDEIKTEDLRQLFGSLRTYGFQLPKSNLLDYYRSFGDMIDGIDTLRGEDGAKRLDIDKLKRANEVLLKKIYLLLEALIKAYDLEPKQQKLSLTTDVKKINKITPKKLLGETAGSLPKPPKAARASKKSGMTIEEVTSPVSSPEPSPIKPESLPALPLDTDDDDESPPKPKKKETKKKIKGKKLRLALPAPAAAPAPADAETKEDLGNSLAILRSNLADLDNASYKADPEAAKELAREVKRLRNAIPNRGLKKDIRADFLEAVGRVSTKKAKNTLKSIAGIKSS